MKDSPGDKFPVTYCRAAPSVDFALRRKKGIEVRLPSSVTVNCRSGGPPKSTVQHFGSNGKRRRRAVFRNKLFKRAKMYTVFISFTKVGAIVLGEQREAGRGIRNVTRRAWVAFRHFIHQTGKERPLRMDCLYCLEIGSEDRGRERERGVS